MGTKYSSNSVSGYNATPPADDGTVSEANKVKWSTIKTKLSDPVNTLAADIDTDLGTHFNIGPNAYTSSQTLGATHYNTINQVSGSGVTLTLTDAATLTAGWFCRVVNTDSSNSVTIARATGGDTINSTAANVTLLPLDTIDIFVIAAATGFRIITSIGIGWPVRRRKTADETVSTSTTLQDDDHLLFPIAASEEWIADFYLSAVGSGADIGSTGIKVAITTPSSATLNVTTEFMGAVASLPLRSTTSGGAMDITTAMVSGGLLTIHINVWVLNSTTAGNITLQWAQSTSTNATVVNKGSNMVAHRVA